ncbi:septum formation family protein [Pseudonocardia spirodelae]|uniref:Septum formation family protein n=1 Tax=Pseudonocardia spirodelae TaxID=3133431 RepID=A0ABU8T434_9PSEU
MDPRSPAGSDRPDDAGPADAYDGYDGRYSRTGHGAPTSVLSRPAAPARRRHGGPDDDGDGQDATALVAPEPAAPAGRSGLSAVRRVGIGILAGALLMLTVASVDSLLGAQVPVLGSFASSGVPRTEEAPPLPPPPDTPGTCLNWTRADATDTAAVDCARPHLFEQTGRVALADQTAFPADAAWQKLVADRCTPVVTKYLNGKFDPDGKFRVGALKPSQQRWDGGDKGMRCGLQMASRSGAMFPITGKVAAQDQSAVQPAGTCLAIDGRTVGDPTDCAGPHAVEAVGIVDLGTEFPDAWPAVEDQDKFLQPACTDAANTFAGNDKVITDKGLTVYWGNLSEESWKAGSRKVNCNIGTLLPDNSGFAAITGSVKGNLTVAGQPAPAAAPSAPGTPATPAAPAGQTPAPGSQAPVEQPDAEQPAAPDAGTGRPDLDIPPGLPGLSGN